MRLERAGVDDTAGRGNALAEAGEAVPGPALARPALPGPPFRPTPSSTISTDDCDSRTEHELAWAWRTTFVRPSRTTHPNSSWWVGSTTSAARGMSAVIPAARSSSRPVASSPASVTSR